MNISVDTTFIHAKVHALHDVLLLYNDYEHLVSTRSFRSISREASQLVDHRNYVSIKELLFSEQIQTVLALASLDTPYRNIFRAFLFLFESINIKHIAAKVFRQSPVITQRYDVSPFSVIPESIRDNACTPKEFREFLQSISITPSARPGSASEYETIESDIDSAILTRFIKPGKEISPLHKKSYYTIIFMFYAITMNSWEHRLASYYGYNMEYITQYMRSINTVLHREKSVRSLWDQINAVIAAHGPGTGISPRGKRAKDYPAIMKWFVRYVSGVYHTSFHSVSCVAAFLILLYLQIQNIFRIVEGLRFRQTPESVLDGIICEA